MLDWIHWTEVRNVTDGVLWEIRDHVELPDGVLQNTGRSSVIVTGNHKGDLWSKKDISERKKQQLNSAENLRYMLFFSGLKMDSASSFREDNSL